MLDGILDLLMDRPFLSEIQLAKSRSKTRIETPSEKPAQKNPLVYSILMKELQTARTLIHSGFDVNSTDEDGRTPLMAAVAINDLEIAKLLVEKKANINAVDHQKLSAIFYTMKSRIYTNSGIGIYRKSRSKERTAMAEFLIQKGANLNIKDSNDKTLLDWTVGEGNFDFVELLIENGVPINQSNDDKNTLARIFARMEKNPDEKEQTFIKLLFSKVQDLSYKDSEGCNYLCLSIKKGNFPITKLLLEKGINPDEKDNRSRTALFIALEEREFEIAKYLIENGAPINQSNDDKNILARLIRTIEKNPDEKEQTFIKLLLNKIQDLSYKDSEGCNYLCLSIKRGNFPITKLLLEKG
ncbi:ankyrin repeat domain-containing protein, partial [Leptospira sp. Fiocruz LV4135]